MIPAAAGCGPGGDLLGGAMSSVSTGLLLVAVCGLIAAVCCVALLLPVTGTTGQMELERLGVWCVGLALAAGAMAALAGGV